MFRAMPGRAALLTVWPIFYGLVTMALDGSSSLVDALTQYKANLRFWESAATAANLLEAVLYLLACKPETIAAADQSVTFTDLTRLREKLEPIVESAAGTRSSFVKGRARYY